MWVPTQLCLPPELRVYSSYYTVYIGPVTVLGNRVLSDKMLGDYSKEWEQSSNFKECLKDLVNRDDPYLRML